MSPADLFSVDLITFEKQNRNRKENCSILKMGFGLICYLRERRDWSPEKPIGDQELSRNFKYSSLLNSELGSDHELDILSENVNYSVIYIYLK